MQLTGLFNALNGLLPAEVAEPSDMPLRHAMLRVMARQEVGLGVLDMVEDALARLLLEPPNVTTILRTSRLNPRALKRGIIECTDDRDCSKCASIFDQHNYSARTGKKW